jgi:gliding motility-associated-like protein
VIITVKDLQPFAINNFISPNGDGINDLWKIEGLGNYDGASVLVFNSEGIIIYQSDLYTNDWDGKIQGKSLPDGTYYYKLVVNDSNGEQAFTGNITLLSGR